MKIVELAEIRKELALAKANLIAISKSKLGKALGFIFLFSIEIFCFYFKDTYRRRNHLRN